MFILISLLAEHDFRTRYAGWIGVVGELLAICLELVIYWYTSKAFMLDPKIGNYFEFIVIGELSLLIPSRLMDGSLEPIRNSKNSDFIETILLSKYGLGRFTSVAALSGVFREIVRIGFYIAVLSLFFRVKFNFVGLLGFLFIQLIYMPMFLCLASLLGSALMYFGRGYHAINKVLMVFVVFSGAYFPQTVLPESLQGLVSKFIPYSAIVANSRTALAGELKKEDILSFILVFLVAGICFYISTKVMDRICLKQLRKDRKFVS